MISIELLTFWLGGGQELADTIGGDHQLNVEGDRMPLRVRSPFFLEVQSANL